MKHAIILVPLSTFVVFSSVSGQGDLQRRGYDITATGLIPRYPLGWHCPPITSTYASWVDVDGSRREEPHSGIDAGNLGDWIVAPASGTVRATWLANWGWGVEGSLLLMHTQDDLRLAGGVSYYSEFDHLHREEIKKFKSGQRITRGERLARVYRPGGQKRYREEVHFEVWEVRNDARTQWKKNEYGGQFWKNDSARLIDPLYLMSLESTPNENGEVVIVPYDGRKDYGKFKGFTYILECAINE